MQAAQEVCGQAAQEKIKTRLMLHARLQGKRAMVNTSTQRVVGSTLPQPLQITSLPRNSVDRHIYPSWHKIKKAASGHG
jgi:hypothetical protein